MLPTLKLVNNTHLESERNICFINTALQLLFSVPRMKTFFHMKEYRLSTEKKRRMQICDEVARLFSSAGKVSSSAAELRRLVASKSGRNYLNDGTQQDTVEFLTTLLQEVEEEISANNWEAKVVVQEFCGTEKNEKKFLNKNAFIQIYFCLFKCSLKRKCLVDKIEQLPSF